MTSLPLERRTRVIFRKAEFGFLGVIVRTCRQTPRFCGQLFKTGDLLNFRFFLRFVCDELVDRWHLLFFRRNSPFYDDTAFAFQGPSFPATRFFSNAVIQ